MSDILNQKKVISSFRWNFLVQLITQGSTFLVGIILMNLLPPEDFGIIATAVVFTGFLNTLSGVGFTASLVQHENIGKKDIDTTYWFSLAAGVVLMVLIALIAQPVALLYGEPILKGIILALSINFVIEPMGTLPINLLKREFDFKKIFIVKAVAVIISCTITIILAYKGWGVWSLVVQRLLLSALIAIVANLLVKYKLGLGFSKELLKKHLGFNVPLLGSKSVLYWIGAADNFLIGYFMSTYALGIYSRAFAFATLLPNQLGFVLFQVIFPYFSRIQNDNNQLKEEFLKMNSFLLFIVTPFAITISIIAKPFILFIVGEKWAESIPILELLCLMALAKVVIRLIHNLFMAKGETKLDLKLNSYLGLLYVAVFIIGSLTNLWLLSVLYVGVTTLILLVYYKVVSNMLSIEFSVLLKIFFETVVIIAIISFSWKLASNFIGELNYMVQIILGGLFAFITWYGFQVLIDRKQFFDNIALAKKIAFNR